MSDGERGSFLNPSHKQFLGGADCVARWKAEADEETKVKATQQAKSQEAQQMNYSNGLPLTESHMTNGGGQTYGVSESASNMAPANYQ